MMNHGAQLLAAMLAERGAQQQFAQETGIDQGYLSRIARGERSPGLKVRRIMVARGIPMDAWELPAANDVRRAFEERETEPGI